jgi:hypothetical protein
MKRGSLMNIFLDFWHQNPWIESVLDSNFVTAVAGALCGAFFGATAAQKIADRNKGKEENLKQIRLINTAISLALTSINTVLALRTQHIDKLKNSFDENKKAFDNCMAYYGRVRQEVTLKLDLEILEMPFLPIDKLETLVLEQIAIARRAPSAVVSLKQFVLNLGSALQTRNGLIRDFNQRGLETEKILPLYFGLKQSGIADATYPGSVDAIHTYTKDVIFYCRVLIDDLVATGKHRAEKYAAEYKVALPHINTADFAKATAGGLIPDDAEYEDWLSGVVMRDEPDKSKGRFWPRLWSVCQFPKKLFNTKSDA